VREAWYVGWKQEREKVRGADVLKRTFVFFLCLSNKLVKRSKYEKVKEKRKKKVSVGGNKQERGRKTSLYMSVPSMMRE